MYKRQEQALDARLDLGERAVVEDAGDLALDELVLVVARGHGVPRICLLYTSPSPRDRTRSRMPSSA